VVPGPSFSGDAIGTGCCGGLDQAHSHWGEVSSIATAFVFLHGLLDSADVFGKSG